MPEPFTTAAVIVLVVIAFNVAYAALKFAYSLGREHQRRITAAELRAIEERLVLMTNCVEVFAGTVDIDAELRTLLEERENHDRD